GALRHLDAAKLLRRHRPAVVAEHGGDVVHAVRVRDEAVPADLLGDLLDRAMQVADVGDGFLHDLPVGADDEAQDPLGARVRPSHAERLVPGAEAAARRLPLHLDFESRQTHPGSYAFRRLSRDVEMPWYSSGSTKSFRRGWPGQSSGMRMRRRSGCPAKVTPSRSNASRSCQSAARHTP